MKRSGMEREKVIEELINEEHTAANKRQAFHPSNSLRLTPANDLIEMKRVPPCRIHSIALISSGVSGSKLIALNWIAG